MRPNIVTEAGVQTRVSQWWNAIPFLTSSVVVVCGIIYLICLLTGYDSFYEVCFLPSAILSRFQVYRFYTAILFHGSMLHVLFNMMALVPMGSELERIMGSVRLFYLTILLATTNAVLHLLIASLAGYNPFYQYDHLMNECAIGFSGILFSMIVIETSLSGVTSRSVFGLFNVPAKLYPWLLLIAFQLLMTNVSLLGHLCGILSGFAYSYGLFNFLMPGSSFFSTIESASWMASCVRRPKFIMCTGGNPSSYMPTYSVQNTTSSGFSTGNAWRSLSSWLPQREASNQSSEDSRFPGRGRTLSGTARDPTPPAGETNPNLHARLLEDSTPDRLSDATVIGIAEPIPAARQVPIANAAVLPPSQGRVAASEEQIQKLVAMGFERTQVEVALAAADDDLNVAVEILMSQQVETCTNQSSIF
uniref:UBA domain-containing protein n=2 Tax=Brassica campestris TaxID=3711 RepID=M4CT52_BRACM